MLRRVTLWAVCALAAAPARAAEPSFDEEDMWLSMSSIESYAAAIRRGCSILEINAWGDKVVLCDAGVGAPQELSEDRKRLRSSVTVIGMLAADTVERVAADHREDVVRCLQTSGRDGGRTNDVVVVKFIVSPLGKFATGSVNDTTVDDPVLEWCLLMATKSWVFPPTSNGGIAVVTYPFQLR